MIIGVSKCGTTDLFGRVTNHRDIVALIKEPAYWNRLRIGKLKMGNTY